MDFGPQDGGDGRCIHYCVGNELHGDLTLFVENDGPQPSDIQMAFPVIQLGQSFELGFFRGSWSLPGQAEIDVDGRYEVGGLRLPYVAGIDERNPASHEREGREMIMQVLQNPVERFFRRA